MAVPLHHLPTATMTISSEERDFFVELGERIAALRKTHSITQTQLAEALKVSQQTVQAYEVGRRRIPVSALPVVAQLLEVSLKNYLARRIARRASVALPHSWNVALSALLSYQRLNNVLY